MFILNISRSITRDLIIHGYFEWKNRHDFVKPCVLLNNTYLPKRLCMFNNIELN